MFETRRCFIATAFQLSFRVCHKEGSGKPGWLEIKWYTSALVYADVNMLDRSVHTTKKNTAVLVVASKEIGLEGNDDKTKCMVMSRDQNSRRSCNLTIDNNSLERVKQPKCLGTTLLDQNSNQEEIRSRLKSGNACYNLVQNLLSSSLLSKNIKVNINGTIILPVVLYGCETWSLALREHHNLCNIVKT